MEKSFAAQAVEIVHTREMRLSTVRTAAVAAACARHNYIMRCTLAYPEDLRRTRPRECYAYPWEPVMRWWSRFPTLRRWVHGGVHAGGCALFPRGDDTGPPSPPVAFVNTSNMLPLDEPMLMRVDLWEPKCSRC